MIQNYKNFAREMEEKIATDLLNSHFMVLSTNSPSQQSVHTFISLFFYLPIYLFIYLFHSIFSVVELPEHHFLLLGSELLLFQGWLYFSPQMPHCIQAWITAKLLLYQYLNCHLEFKKNGHINFIEMSSQEKIFTIHKMHG